MFLKPPKSKPNAQTSALKTWEDNYLCVYEGALHPIVVKVHYAVPSCEIIAMDFLPPAGFEELRVADYAKQAIGQQALTDYLAFAEKTTAVIRKSAKLDDPFFEEKP